jgi:propanol-preferring alcohol dehydrogenase
MKRRWEGGASAGGIAASALDMADRDGAGAAVCGGAARAQLIEVKPRSRQQPSMALIGQWEDAMTATMRAAVARELGGPLTIEEVPVPRPDAGEILVRVQACGVCHTDLHAVDGDWPVKPSLPLIPGHEGVGIVAAVGRGVAGVKEGDRVGMPWLYSACGVCEHCLGGWETLCEAQRNTGYSVAGSYADYVIADPRFVGHLPASLDFAAAAPILCAGVTVYKGLKATGARPGQWVAISGVGGLGHVAVQYARAMGLHVAAVDVDEAKLDLARRLGAEISVNARQQNAADVLGRQHGGMHAALVTAVSTQACTQAIGLLRRGGTAVFVGLPPGQFALPVFDLVLRGISVRGSIVGTRLDLAEALAFAAEGRVEADVRLERLEDINRIFQQLRRGQVTGRVVLDLRA